MRKGEHLRLSSDIWRRSLKRTRKGAISKMSGKPVAKRAWLQEGVVNDSR